MITAIVGKKGSGKTKLLNSMINTAASVCTGSIACIEKGSISTFRVNYGVRLVDADEFHVDNADKLYGLISGLIAGNYDIKQVFIDATFRIIGRDDVVLYDFLCDLRSLSEKFNVEFILTLSCAKEDLVGGVFDICTVKEP